MVFFRVRSFRWGTIGSRPNRLILNARGRRDWGVPTPRTYPQTSAGKQARHIRMHASTKEMDAFLVKCGLGSEQNLGVIKSG